MKWWVRDKYTLRASGKIEYRITYLRYSKEFSLTVGIEKVGVFPTQEKAIRAAEDYEKRLSGG